MSNGFKTTKGKNRGLSWAVLNEDGFMTTDPQTDQDDLFDSREAAREHRRIHGGGKIVKVKIYPTGVRG